MKFLGGLLNIDRFPEYTHSRSHHANAMHPTKDSSNSSLN